MQEDLIGYDEIIENSMRSVIYEALKKIEKTGLPGKHYFIITFLTHYPEVELCKELKEKYNEEMTIAVQFQFRNLVVEQDRFKVSLSFNGKYERLSIPFRAITSFADPSINFALKFSLSYGDIEDIKDGNIDEVFDVPKQANKNYKKKLEVDLTAKVVSLDAFRKQKIDLNNNNNDE